MLLQGEIKIKEKQTNKDMSQHEILIMEFPIPQKVFEHFDICFPYQFYTLNARSKMLASTIMAIQVFKKNYKYKKCILNHIV